MSERDVVARLVDVGKEYVKYEDTPTLLMGLIRAPARTKRGRLWAIRHMNLEVLRGESVGVVGRNGAGKSTTLAILAGVTAPTEGIVSVRGRLAPLLRLGVGFHEELTGRENVYVNGMVLGMTKAEIDERFDEIVEFAEIERFVDTPVKFYSSGMQVRLGFSSAIASRPDLLLVDEVLSVGDIGFQTKSFDKMQELREQGATLIVVSHNIDAIRRTCDRAVVVDQGTPVFSGRTSEAISAYHELLRDASPDHPHADARVRIPFFEMYGPDGTPTANVEVGDKVTFRMRVVFDDDVTDPAFGFWISTESAQMVYADNTLGTTKGTYKKGAELTIEVRIAITLATGNFIAGGGVRFGREIFELASAPRKSFSVAGRDSVYGTADLAAEFEVPSGDAG